MGVEEVTRERGFVADFGGCAIEPVADDGVADAGEVYADLMGAAGADADLEEGKTGEAAEDAKFARGGAAMG